MPLDIHNKSGEKVIDNYNSFERWEKWIKNPKLRDIGKANEEILILFLKDKKKEVSFRRINDLMRGLPRIAKLLEKHLGLADITTITEDQYSDFIDMLKDGKIKSRNNKKYSSISDIDKNFKTFWNWYKKYAKKKLDKIIPDVTEGIRVKKEKPEFHYFTFEQLRKLADHSKYEYKVFQYFLFDSGARPQEALNINAKDITPVENSNFLYLNIRDEIAKTFGRKIKLMVCHEILKEYIETNKLKADDFLFPIKPIIINKYLGRLGHKVLGIGCIEVKKKNDKVVSWIKDGLVMYDYRHSSACYWAPRYKSESTLKYRFGWKKSNMIHYYTEFLGMKDTIQEEDMLIDTTKTELQRELENEKKQRELLQDRIISIEEDNNKTIQFIREFDLLLFSILDKIPEKQFKQIIPSGELKSAFDKLKILDK